MEAELIAWLRERLPPHPLLRLGPGDDAAVLRMAGIDECVLTVDMLTDHVDFELARDDPRRVGRKALAVNLSDLAAMAAKPLAGVIAAVLPRQGGMELARELYEGLLPLAERYDLAIAGGDTNSWDGPLALSVTLLGRTTAHGPLLPRRSPARRPHRRHRRLRRQHPRPSLRFPASRASKPCLLNERYELARRHRRAATGCRSICRTWPPKAVAAPSFKRDAVPIGDAAAAIGRNAWPTAPPRLTTPWATAKISS